MPDERELTEAEQRHFWRLRWLSALQAFADCQQQGERWTDPEETNPHFSFVECMCCYFDDADVADLAAYDRRIEKGYLTISEAKSVSQFHNVADQYRPPNDDDYDVVAILADPGWQSVVRAAQGAQARLLSLLTDPREIAALTKPAVWQSVGASFHGSYPDPS